MVNIVIVPHIFPHMVTPTMFPVDKKASSTKKTLGQQCINSFLTSTQVISRSLVMVFLGGRSRVPTRRCDLVVPAAWGWGRGN